MTTIKDKVVIITGAGSGIGEETAHILAADGAIVVAVDINNAETVAEEIKGKGYEAFGAKLDVTNAEQWEDIKKRTLEKYGRIDALANIAGISTDTYITDLSEQDFEQMLNVNLKGPFLGMKTVLPEFIAQKSGKIVNITSLAAHIGITQLPSYSASKGGLIALSRQVAVEYAEHNIQVNCVSPGVIETPILANNPAGVTDMHLANTPANRLGKPAEIAYAIRFLISNDSDFITGQTLKVDGGWGSH
ncbi:MAG: glucose 1-dehydrogenase [Eubacteriales bacterium]|nr:glucose 1-dehydrogenase [Eubacteriales bacterium]